MPDPIKLSAKTPFTSLLPGDRIVVIRRPQDESDPAKRVASVALNVLAAQLFAPITANQYGTHPAFTTQAAVNAYLLGGPAPAESVTITSVTPS